MGQFEIKLTAEDAESAEAVAEKINTLRSLCVLCVFGGELFFQYLLGYFKLNHYSIADFGLRNAD